MIGHHVAQSSSLIKIAASAFHAHGLSHGDLHVINIAAIPDRLEDAVGKAKGHDVLHRLFAQIVIYAVDLFLVGQLE